MKKGPYFKVLPFAALIAAVGAAVGLLFGLVYSVGGFFIDLATTGLNQGTALAFFALIGMPAIGVVIGFIAGLVQVFAINLFTKFFPKLIKIF